MTVIQFLFHLWHLLFHVNHFRSCIYDSWGIPWQIRRLYTTTSPKFFKFGSEVSPSEINKTQKNFWVLTSRGRDIGIWNFENLGVPGNFKHQYLSHKAWYKVIWGINLMLMNQTFKIRLLGIFFSTPKKVSP